MYKREIHADLVFRLAHKDNPTQAFHLGQGRAQIAQVQELRAFFGLGQAHGAVFEEPLLPGPLAAARAFCEGTDWPPERIAKRAIELASEICIYTDNVVTLEVLE